MNRVLRKRCSGCKVEKSTDDFHRGGSGVIKSRCKVCTLQGAKEKNLREDERLRRKAYRLRTSFGITVADYDTLAQTQGNKCAICQMPPETRALDVDHDHKTGAIRGLLCKTCNVGLGNFFDDVRRLSAAIEYLKSQGEKQCQRELLALN